MPTSISFHSLEKFGAKRDTSQWQTRRQLQVTFGWEGRKKDEAGLARETELGNAMLLTSLLYK